MREQNPAGARPPRGREGVPANLSRTPSARTPEAKLIILCSRLCAIELEKNALHAVRRSIEDERITEPHLGRLYDEARAIMNKVEKIGLPPTPAAAVAMARASMAICRKDLDGDYNDHPGADRLAFMVAEFVSQHMGA